MKSDGDVWVRYLYPYRILACKPLIALRKKAVTGMYGSIPTFFFFSFFLKKEKREEVQIDPYNPYIPVIFVFVQIDRVHDPWNRVRGRQVGRNEATRLLGTRALLIRCLH